MKIREGKRSVRQKKCQIKQMFTKIPLKSFVL